MRCLFSRVRVPRKLHRRPLLAPLSATTSWCSKKAEGGGGLKLARGAPDAQTTEFSLRRFLTEEQKRILSREKEALSRLREVLRALGFPDEDDRLLRGSIEQLEEMFLVVVVGEFNSGKSCFINALLGGEYCKEGILPTTSHINILRYGEKLSEEIAGIPGGDDTETRTTRVPVDWLKETNLVDTPGTNAILAGHTQITEHFVPRADIIVFVTSVDRPFTDSERQFLEKIHAWRKNVLLVVNKVDSVGGPSSQPANQVVEFVRSNAASVLQENNPPVFPTSAKGALSVKLENQRLSTPLVSSNSSSPKTPKIDADGDEAPPQVAAEPRTAAGRVVHPSLRERWVETGFPELETYISKTLDCGQRVRLKMNNPLGVGMRMLKTAREMVSRRRALLRDDEKRLGSIQQDLLMFEEDVTKELDSHLAKLDTVLLEMLQRVEEFLDKRLVLSNIGSLVRARALTDEFHEEVTRHVADDIQDVVANLVDWVAERNHRQFRAVEETLKMRTSPHSSEADSSSSSSSTTSSSPRSSLSSFEEEYHQRAEESIKQADLEVYATRQTAVSDLQRIASETHQPLTRRQTSENLEKEINLALMQTGALEMGALGLTTLVGTAALDWTGMAGAGVLALAGLYVLPHHRGQVRASYRRAVARAREDLRAVVRRHFRSEIERALRKVKGALAPYDRFVRRESAHVNSAALDIDGVAREIDVVRLDVGRIGQQLH